MGAKINLTNKKFINNEKVADIFVKSSNLHGCELDEKYAKLMISISCIVTEEDYF